MVTCTKAGEKTSETRPQTGKCVTAYSQRGNGGSRAATNLEHLQQAESNPVLTEDWLLSSMEQVEEERLKA